MATLERHNPNQWGYAGMTTTMKRNGYRDDDDDNNQPNPPPKLSTSSRFIPPAFQSREPIQLLEHPKPSVAPPPEPPQPFGLLNDNLIQRLVGNTHPPSVSVRLP